MTEKKLETYQDLCTQYYDLDNGMPADEWNFYKKYVQQARGTILEPMCGTGRFLLPFLKEGFVVEGFDASPAMLAKLHEHAARQGLHPRVWQGFIEDFSGKDNRYHLIFIPAGSLNLLVDQQVVIASLHALYAALVSGGTFVFELITLDFISSVESGVVKSGVMTRSDGKKIVQVSMQSPLQEGVSVTQARYVLFEQEEALATEVEEYKLRFYQEGYLEDFLHRVGFVEIKTIKAFDHHKKPEKGDMVVIYECKKP